MNYDILAEFNLEPKVDYFVSYYLYKAHLYNRNATDISTFNLHSLITLIIEELSKNNKNRNLKFFYNKLQEIKKKDSIIKNKYEYKTNEVLQNIISNKDYALIVSKNLLLELDNGMYGKEICKRIEKILFNNEKLEDIKDKLTYLIDSLLIEFIIYGYNEKSFDKLLYNIFSKYTVYNNYVSTNFPIPPYMENEKIKECSVTIDVKQKYRKKVIQVV